MVVNLRGTNGSGKTTVAKGLILRYQMTPLYDEASKGRQRAWGYTAQHADLYPLFVLGDYEGDGKCGGCDRISKQDEVCFLVREMHNRGFDVLFEGVVVSTIFERYVQLSKDVGGMVWAFLDTPLAVCLNRIQARNGGKPVKVDQIQDKWTTMRRIQTKAQAVGERVEVISYKESIEETAQIFETYWLEKGIICGP